ncbi:MAG: hypothetical protein ACYST3_03570 [Planctomycetota bacterium]|jgi:hypothetical protein
MVYSLDPVKAYDLGLVKQIEVDSIVTENDFNKALVCLEKTNATKTRTSARVKIDVNTKDGVKRKAVTVKVDDDLYELSNKREIYKNGYIVNGIDVGDGFIELSNGEAVFLGDTLGGLNDEVMKVQIKKTIEEHFLKERKFKNKGIKVHRLFFLSVIFIQINPKLSFLTHYPKVVLYQGIIFCIYRLTVSPGLVHGIHYVYPLFIGITIFLNIRQLVAERTFVSVELLDFRHFLLYSRCRIA